MRDVSDKLYVHSDDAQLYKCYDVGELIVRIVCLVHMRRSFFKLRDYSTDADEITRIMDKIFRTDRNIISLLSPSELNAPYR